MVHALEQAWQVLRPGGVFVDLRPLSLDSALDIVGSQGMESAGMVDMSADLPDDRAVDEAIEAAVRAEVFIPRETRKFDFAYYWDTFEGMRRYTTERWDTAKFPSAVLRKARALKNNLGPGSRIQIILPMHLATYERARHR
jgi:hypothetical protein